MAHTCKTRRISCSSSREGIPAGPPMLPHHLTCQVVTLEEPERRDGVLTIALRSLRSARFQTRMTTWMSLQGPPVPGNSSLMQGWASLLSRWSPFWSRGFTYRGEEWPAALAREQEGQSHREEDLTRSPQPLHPDRTCGWLPWVARCRQEDGRANYHQGLETQGCKVKSPQAWMTVSLMREMPVFHTLGTRGEGGSRANRLAAQSRERG